MARKIIWATGALDDVDAIAEYIAVDSPSYAAIVSAKIIKIVDESAENPELGRMVPEWRLATHRERIIYSYRLIYRVDPERIVILAVMHGAMLLEEFIKDRPVR